MIKVDDKNVREYLFDLLPFETDIRLTFTSKPLIIISTLFGRRQIRTVHDNTLDHRRIINRPRLSAQIDAGHGHHHQRAAETGDHVLPHLLTVARLTVLKACRVQFSVYRTSRFLLSGWARIETMHLLNDHRVAVLRQSTHLGRLIMVR